MRGRCGGHLDVDMNAGAPYSRAPVENIYWEAAPKGRYRIWVENFCHRDGQAATPFTCILRRKGTPPLQLDGKWSAAAGDRCVSTVPPADYCAK
jgi:hypothetical protein